MGSRTWFWPKACFHRQTQVGLCRNRCRVRFENAFQNLRGIWKWSHQISYQSENHENNFWVTENGATRILHSGQQRDNENSSLWCKDRSKNASWFNPQQILNTSATLFLCKTGCWATGLGGEDSSLFGNAEFSMPSPRYKRCVISYKGFYVSDTTGSMHSKEFYPFFLCTCT